MIYRCITIVFWVVCLLFQSPITFGQESSIRINIVYPDDTPEEAWLSRVSERTYSDSTDLYRALDDLRDRYYKLGYLSAGFDSIESSGHNYKANFFAGLKYEWGRINLPESHPKELPRIPGRIKLKSGKPLRISEGDALREGLIRIYENNGYPFAAASYDSLSFTDGIFNANIVMDAGPLIIVDSIINRSDKIVANRILEQILGVKPGQVYSEERIRKASINLERSRIIQVVNPLEIGFTDEKAWVYLGAKKKSANSFDGIIGLVPGASASDKIGLTGSVDLELNNTLKQAESFSLRWKAPGNKDQRLRAGFDLPYLMGWPLGIASSMEIYRKDSSYLNTNWKAGLMVDLGQNSRVGFYYKSKNSNVLLKEKNDIYSDVKISLYGVNWSLDNVSNPSNPSQGFIINANAGVGNKNPVDIDSGDEEVIYWEGITESDVFIPIARTWVLNFGAAGGYMQGGRVSDNEKFKIGGIHSLRGFEEESIVANAYLVGTIELRYLFSANSNVHLFYDAGTLWYPGSGSESFINPSGFGIGVSLETRAGILMLDYALGTSKNTPVNISQGKIHLGIKSLF